jgi:hypothetical protein
MGKHGRDTECRVGGHGKTRRGADQSTGGCLASNSDSAARKDRKFRSTETVFRHWRETLDVAVKEKVISAWAQQQALGCVQSSLPYAPKICGCCEKFIADDLVPRAVRFDESRAASAAAAATASEQFGAAAGGAPLPPRNAKDLPMHPLDDPLLRHIVSFLDPRSAYRLAQTCRRGLEAYHVKVKLERLDLLEELLDIRAEYKALQKAYENGYRGIVKVREEHGKARKKVTKLRKDSDKLIKSHAKELKKVEARADARAQTEYKHVLQEKAALEQAVALLLAQIKSLLAEKVAEGDGAVESLEGVVVKMRSSTKGRPVLGRWRDLIAKLHVFYTIGQEKCLPALVDVIEAGGATVADAPSKSDYLTCACTHEVAEYARLETTMRICLDVCGSGWKAPADRPAEDSSTPRLARVDCGGVYVPQTVPLGTPDKSWIAPWQHGIEWARAGCPDGWLEMRLAAVGLELPNPMEFQLDKVAAANPSWYFPGPHQEADVKFVDPAPGYAAYSVGSDGFSNFADISCTAVSVGMGRTAFRDRSLPGLDEQAEMVLLGLVEDLEGHCAADELASVLAVLRDCACRMVTLGVPAAAILRPLDFLEMMLDNTSAMTGRFRGLHTQFEQVRGGRRP